MSKISIDQRLEMRQCPKETSIMSQEWRDLFFMSWKYDKDTIQESLPPGLFVDTFEGDSYITIVPFKIQNFKVANLPSIPIFSDFVEVNVRTYVYDKNGLPGIWFYSLDINSIIAATTARQLFSLPYYNAELKMSKNKNEFEIIGKRSDVIKSDMQFSYRNENNLIKEDPKLLDFFLIERYALFSFSANQLYIQRIHHSPYPLSQGTLLDYESRLFELNSFLSPGKNPDHICYSYGVNVDFFPLKKI